MILSDNPSLPRQYAQYFAAGLLLYCLTASPVVLLQALTHAALSLGTQQNNSPKSSIIDSIKVCTTLQVNSRIIDCGIEFHIMHRGIGGREVSCAKCPTLPSCPSILFVTNVGCLIHIYTCILSCYLYA